VNSEVTLPSGLASVGGTPRAFAVPGAVGVLVTTIGAEGQESGPGDGGRVALPVSPKQARSALTIVRVLIANPRAENVFRRAIAEGEVPVWSEPPPRRPGEVQSIMVELYGGKADVEALARRLPTAALRRLLDRS
jgi:hypothetical protein